MMLSHIPMEQMPTEWLRLEKRSLERKGVFTWEQEERYLEGRLSPTEISRLSQPWSSKVWLQWAMTKAEVLRVSDRWDVCTKSHPRAQRTSQKRGRKDVRDRWGALWHPICWTRQSHCSHEFTASMATYTRSSQFKISSRRVRKGFLGSSHSWGAVGNWWLLGEVNTPLFGRMATGRSPVSQGMTPHLGTCK